MIRVKIRHYIILSLILVVAVSCSHMDYRTKTVGAFKDTGAGKGFVILSKSQLEQNALKLDKLGVYVRLYRGYAVVKEDYTINNTTQHTLKIKMGIPLNGYFHSDVIDTVFFRSWSHPELSINGKRITQIQKQRNHSIHIPKLNLNEQQWDTWNYSFPPDTSHLITHYIVDTHGAHIRDGFDIEYSDGFTYLFSPLQQWNKRIPQIRILFKVVKTSVRMKWIDGILPAGRFKLRDHTFIYDMKDVNPDTLSNIIFRYGKPSMYAPTDGFSFSTVASDTVDYYHQINQSNIWSVDTTGYKTFNRAEFKPAPMGFFSVSGLVIVFLLLGLGFVLLIAWGAYSQYKNS